jgi:O-antigen ligase
MIQSPKSGNKTTPPHFAALLLISTMADTTWRAFVPTIGGTFLGIGLDKVLNLAPLMTIIFIILGFTVSALLIVLQIRAVRR